MISACASQILNMIHTKGYTIATVSDLLGAKVTFVWPLNVSFIRRPYKFYFMEYYVRTNGCVTLHPRIFHPFTFILGFSSSGFFILRFFILSIFIPALSSSHFHPCTFILALSSLHFHPWHFHPWLFHPRTFILALSSLHFHPCTFILALSSSHFHPHTFIPPFSYL